MARVSSIPFPETSEIAEQIGVDDFADCYSANATASPRDAAEVGFQFPIWASMLVALRNILVTPFGLSHGGSEEKECIGFFPVVSETDKEIVLGFDDKHLNFRISLISDGSNVSLGTWVKTNNLGGRLYLNLIMPFHIAIARNAVARMAQAYPPLAPA